MSEWYEKDVENAWDRGFDYAMRKVMRLLGGIKPDNPYTNDLLDEMFDDGYCEQCNDYHEYLDEEETEDD